MKAVVLDRDGVINYDSENYIRTPEDWVPIEGSLRAIARLNQAGYLVAVATNQSGLARGYFSEQTLGRIHQKMTQKLASEGGWLDSIVWCHHHPDDGCGCRKPKPGLLERVLAEWKIKPSQVSFVGDSLRDIQAAWSAGVKPVLVKTGNGVKTFSSHWERLQGVAVYDNLEDYVSDLLAMGGLEPPTSAL
ncbi:MAG TPA: D-glycero-beta-D-manno-heptose 1,7-bisphosphate 7-phosphatase [Gammaproteobacteria bacterium]|nr:D-glycero-beta-D-manno-heptose 1,7-bisphosphate 7-phosphatase [Gammaproteobacteria bacterium]